MADYRTMFEGRYLGAWNLVDPDGNQREVTITIDHVEAQQIVGEGGKTNKKPVITFQGGKWLPMVCGKTVARTIAGMYGNDTRHWVGKRITLYATTTQVGGQEKDCIRVRPMIPPANGKAKGAADANPS